jgi:methyl-accepting chemotaxis protein
MKKKNTRKRVPIARQWTKSIMILIILLLITLGFGMYFILQNLLKTTISLGISGLSSVVSYEFEDSNIQDISRGLEDTKAYNELDKALKYLKDSSKGMVENAYIVGLNEENKLVYIIGDSKDGNAKYGDLLNNADDEVQIKKAIDSGNLTINKDGYRLGDKSTILASYIPIKLGNGGHAVLCADFKSDILIKIALAIIITVGIFLAAALIIVRIIITGIAKKQTRSIYLLVDKMKDMAELKGDLTQRINIDSNDEIGDLALYTNKMLDTQQEILLSVSNAAKTLHSTSDEFENSFKNVATDFEQINKLVQNITERIEEQANELQTTTDKVQHISEAAYSVAENQKRVSEQANNTSNSTFEGDTLMHELRSGSDQISDVVAEASDLVGSLSEKSAAINGIADTITAIAEQTNLLALNASIEAARAGEQGKGFAVVADEVRKLAEESSKSAKEIFDLIQEVQKGITDMKLSMTTIAEKTHESNNSVVEVSKKFQEIATSIEEVSNAVYEVSATSEKMTSSTEVITNAIENLANISEENTSAAEEVASNVNNQTSTIHKLTSSAEELNDISSDLKQRLSKLKLE